MRHSTRIHDRQPGSKHEVGIQVKALRVFPATAAQRRMWFLQRSDPAGSAYNEALAFDIFGELKVSALRKALEDVTARHAVLRTALRGQNGSGVEQVVYAYVPVKLTTVGLDARDDRNAALDNELRKAVTEPIDLGVAPTARYVLTRLSPEHHVLCLVLHHAICDEHSWPILCVNLFDRYTDRHMGRNAPVARLDAEYESVAPRQSVHAADDRTRAGLGYWAERLGADQVMAPLHQKPSSDQVAGPAARVRLPIPAELSARLREFGRRRRLTPFTLFFAAFALVLHRHGSAERMLVGAPMTTREKAADFQIMGLFVNTCLLRADFTGDPTLGEFLKRCQESVVGAVQHRSVPFDAVVALGRLAGEGTDYSAFQTMCNLRTLPPVPRRLGETGLELRLRDLPPGEAKLPLSVVLAETAPDASSNASPDASSDAELIVEYDAAAFGEAAVRRLALACRAALRLVLEDPDVPVSGLDPLSRAERREVDAWSAGPTRGTERDPAGEPHTVVSLFSRRAAAQPHRPAIGSRGTTLSYRALEERSNRLANHLLARGAGREAPVAVLAPRSPELLIALLAVLKAGAAYLPLDPAYPTERLRRMVEDCSPQVVVTWRCPSGAAPPTGAGTVICMRCEAAAIAASPNTPPPVTVHPDDLAYVVYTSGSTGRPNGVEVTHRSLANHASAIMEGFELRPTDRALQFSSPGFDQAAEEIFPVWAVGGCVEVAPGSVLAARDFERLVDAAGVTVANIPTAYWEQWALERADEARAFPRALRLVVVGNSAMSAQTLALWRRHAPSTTTVLHVYGVTEATITSTAGRADVVDRSRHVPIGRPLANMSAHVLDHRLRPLPVGATGELYLGGSGLARGYHARAGLTAQRFVPDPFGHGARLYRTGDLARWLPDGSLEFAGRVDDQINVHGHRVEPLEVERTLAAHPEVLGAVTGQAGDRLAAWVVPRPANPAELDLPALRGWLGDRLPHFMIPSVWLRIPEIPRTSTGKVDRSRLPEPAPDRTASADRHEPPSGPVERHLADVWREALNLRRVGVHEDFFALGGDSLISLRVVSLARRRGLLLSTADVLRLPTIAEQARAARAVDPAPPGGAPGPGPCGATADVPLTPIQHWFFALRNPTPQHWDQVALFTAEPGLDHDILRAAIDALTDHHDALRLRFERDRTGWRQTVRPAGQRTAPALHRVDVKDVPQEARVAELDRRARELQVARDLELGPLLLVLYGETPPGEPDLLLVSTHHLATDGPSTDMLRADLFAAYRRLAAGRPVDLPAPPLSFADWAGHLAGLAEEPAITADRDFWLEQVAPGALALPTDHSRGPADEGSVAMAIGSLDRATTAALRSTHPGRVHEVLLAGLAQALARHPGPAGSRTGEIVVEIADHGRHPLGSGLDPSRTAGWMSTLFPLRIPLSPRARPRDTLHDIRRIWRSVPNGGISYGLLRYHRDESRRVPASGAEVMFNYLGRFESEAGEGGQVRALPDRPMSVRSAEAHRAWPLTLTSAIVDGELLTRLVFSRNRHEVATAEGVVQRYHDAVRALARR